MRANAGATGPYLIAYAVTLASFTVIWFNYPIYLYIGRDASLSLWLARTYGTWAYPFDVTAMNPFQGMTSMLMAVNPYFNPGTWIFQTGLPEVPKQVVSFIVYFVEVTASTFVLAVTLGFSRQFAFVGALWLAFLLFPPFNFVYGLQGWLATSPIYGHTLSLSNLLLVAFMNIGAETRAAPGAWRTARAQLAACQRSVLLVLLIVLAAPFYNGGMLIGTFLLTGVIFLASQSVRQMLWHLTAGVYVMACCAALGFSDFFAGAQAYTAAFPALTVCRCSFTGPSCSPPRSSPARGRDCARGRQCGPPRSMAARAHRIVLAAGEHPRGRHCGRHPHAPAAGAHRRFARRALWLALLMIWIGASVGVITAPPLSPVYFYLTMYPFWAFLSLYAGLCLIDLVSARLPLRARLARPRLGVRRAVRRGRRTRPAVPSPGFARVQVERRPTRAATPIAQALVQEIGLRPGQTFRGSESRHAARFTRSPLRQQPLGNADRPAAAARV